MSKHLIVFRYHNDPTVLAVLENRVTRLRAQNPGVEIHGLWAGPGKAARRDLFDKICAPPFDPYYGWKNGDLMLRWWHQKIGRKIPDWKIAVVLEWDLILTAPVSRLYQIPKIAKGKPLLAIWCSAIVSMLDRRAGSHGRTEDWSWLQGRHMQGELERLRQTVARDTGYQVEREQDHPVCLMPGFAASRDMLDRYAKLNVPSAMHDEARFPLYAKALGATIIDTGFAPPENSQEDYFNCEKIEVSPSRITKKHAAYHPVFGPVVVRRKS